MKGEICDIINRSGFRLVNYSKFSPSVSFKHAKAGSEFSCSYVLEALDPEETLFNILYYSNPESYSILSSFLNKDMMEETLCAIDDNVYSCQDLFERITGKDGLMVETHNNRLKNYEARKYHDGFCFCACNQCWLVLPIGVMFAITNPKTGYFEACGNIEKVEKKITELIVLT